MGTTSCSLIRDSPTIPNTHPVPLHVYNGNEFSLSESPLRLAAFPDNTYANEISYMIFHTEHEQTCWMGLVTPLCFSMQMPSLRLVFQR